jgi:hypothetical protein
MFIFLMAVLATLSLPVEPSGYISEQAFQPMCIMSDGKTLDVCPIKLEPTSVLDSRG